MRKTATWLFFDGSDISVPYTPTVQTECRAIAAWRGRGRTSRYYPR
jgi:hypothetical protein